jgi:membrane-bound lytic murein transglycosylase B
VARMWKNSALSLARGGVIALAFMIAAPAAAPAQQNKSAAFKVWLKDFEKYAQGKGIKPATLKRALARIGYNAKVIEYDNYQPEFVQPIGIYVNARTTPETIAKGRALQRQYRTLFAKVEKKFGVPAKYILAIWRLETNYGANFGSFNVLEALATLAFDGRRKGFWRDELIAALTIVQRGDVPLKRLVGSWAGAMGHTQFIPSTYLRRAIDFDGDGKRDLWGSLPDVFGSTANYLAKAGWKTGLPFGVEVKLPKGFKYELAAPKIWQPAEAWLALGVKTADGKPLPASTKGAEARILLPSGYKGPAFMVFGNYKAILRYNNAAAYALSVGLLAERIGGRGKVKAPWPLNDRLLKRDEKEELQRLLIKLGFDPGPVDGKVGPSTQAAIRAFQKSAGVPADAYANYDLLLLARKKSATR